MSCSKRTYSWMREDDLGPHQKSRTDTTLPGANLECEFTFNSFENGLALSPNSALSPRDTNACRDASGPHFTQPDSSVEFCDGPELPMDMQGVDGQGSSEAEICFGATCKLSDCQAACPNGFGLDRICFTRVVKDDSVDRKFPIVSEQNYYVLKFSMDKGFAILDSSTTRVLQIIQNIGAFRFQAVLSLDRSKRSGEAVGQKYTRSFVEISVNIYGLLSQAKAISNALEKSRQYLQHPTLVDVGIDYMNPQYVVAPGTSNILNNMIGASGRTAVSTQTICSEVERIMDSLNGVASDTDIAQTGQVLTPLLSHQNAAIKFIQQKESSQETLRFKQPAAVAPRLREVTEDHTISRAGLLADEVGLGKTLTMLSAIANSLKEAYEFSFSIGPGLVDQRPLQRIRATLVVVPSAQLIEVWKDEVARHMIPGSLQVATFLGKNRPREREEFAKLDLVLTTYSTLAKDLQNHRLLYGFCWFRSILDEAHWIRNQSTQCFRAVNELQADRRWCLTATPIHNSLDDLGALVRFLKIRPFHEKSSTLAFRRYLLDPVTSNSNDPYENLRNLLRGICLRRRRENNSSLNVKYHRIELRMSHEERSVYNAVFEQTKLDMNEQISILPVAQRYVKLFALFLRLRMVCDLGIAYQVPSLTSIQNATPATKRNPSTSASLDLGCDFCRRWELQEEVEEEKFCPLCSQLLPDTAETASSDSDDKPDNVSQIADSIFQGIRDQRAEAAQSQTRFEGPTKLLAVINVLTENVPETKSVVFSCWTSTLDVLGSLLDAKRIPYVRIDGGISYPERSKRLADYQDTSDISVLLMTFGTGAVGLNLACASQIHILEPQWNPMVEEQAIGRALRLNQKREVTVIRYVMEGTIEKYILDKQQKKKNLARFAFGETKETSMKQKLADLESALHYS